MPGWFRDDGLRLGKKDPGPRSTIARGCFAIVRFRLALLRRECTRVSLRLFRRQPFPKDLQ